ncbi:MAG: hypothetical protein KDE63_11800 [Novosphingobium sp.]|nr:hypothetical protein [Novosphingobium sp.]
MYAATLISTALIAFFGFALVFAGAVIVTSLRTAIAMHGPLRAALSAISDVRVATYQHKDTVVRQRPLATVTWLPARRGGSLSPARNLPLAA